MRADVNSRITIPKNLRENFGIDENSDLDLIPTKDGILIQKNKRDYEISVKEMQDLRLLYMELKDTGFLDEKSIKVFADATKEVPGVACPKCNSSMFESVNKSSIECVQCKKKCGD